MAEEKIVYDEAAIEKNLTIDTEKRLCEHKCPQCGKPLELDSESSNFSEESYYADLYCHSCEIKCNAVYRFQYMAADSFDGSREWYPRQINTPWKSMNAVETLGFLLRGMVMQGMEDYKDVPFLSPFLRELASKVPAEDIPRILAEDLDHDLVKELLLEVLNGSET